MALVNMKSKPGENEPQLATESGEEPRYPYGLCLHLGKEELEKLGITTLPEVGATMMVHANGYVKSTSAYDTQRDGKSMSVEIQLTDLEVVPGEAKSSAEIMYGKE